MKNWLVGAAIAVAAVAAPERASAVTITVADCYNGCTGLTGAISVVITSAVDVGPLDATGSNPAAGQGRLKVTVTNGSNAYLRELALFYDGGLPNPTYVEGFSMVSGTATAPSITLGPPNGTGGGLTQTLNFSFNYGTSNATRFDAGEKMEFYLDAGSALLVTKFANAAYAHVQEVGGGSGSAKLQACLAGSTDPDCSNAPPFDGPPVPEPTTLALFGMGLLGAGYARRRKQ